MTLRLQINIRRKYIIQLCGIISVYSKTKPDFIYLFGNQNLEIKNLLTVLKKTIPKSKNQTSFPYFSDFYWHLSLFHNGKFPLSNTDYPLVHNTN